MSWEDRFRTWAQPPGSTEQEKCDNAERAVRRAIAASAALRDHSVTVFPQGSYRNRTNVKADSDVDIGVLCTDTFFYDLPTGITAPAVGIIAPSYTYDQYRRDVGAALVSHLGATNVRPGNKAFDVHENTNRIDADVVACFEYRFYQADGSYVTGTGFIPTNGTRIHNYPEQNYSNGVTKNDATGRSFKALVRILKNLKNEMAEKRVVAGDLATSYFIECLVSNVPNEGFAHDTYAADVRWVLAYIFNETMGSDRCQGWTEINGIKYLFHASQPWTCEQAHLFADAAWNYLGLT